MDPRLNPYQPGAGTPPPELAGRDTLLEEIELTIDRSRNGYAEKPIVLIGLRGVGKTVVLERARGQAEGVGCEMLYIEAPETKSLPALLAPALRRVLLSLSSTASAKDMAKRALKGLAGFVSGLSVTYADIELKMDYEAEPGLADTGALDEDLKDLLIEIGKVAKQANSVVVIFIDELQHVADDQLSALWAALHRCGQLKLPITLVGAGLPQLLGRSGNAQSYTERMVSWPRVGRLGHDDAKKAIVSPANALGVTVEDDAVELILEVTRGYPYFLQEWGKAAWNVATDSKITRQDVEAATDAALAILDQDFFKVRFDRLTPVEKLTLRAMAELGPGPYKTGDIAGKLGKRTSDITATREKLIKKGMIYSAEHGLLAFTVPLFDEYMMRTPDIQ